MSLVTGQSKEQRSIQNEQTEVSIPVFVHRVLVVLCTMTGVFQ